MSQVENFLNGNSTKEDLLRVLDILANSQGIGIDVVHKAVKTIMFTEMPEFISFDMWNQNRYIRLKTPTGSRVFDSGTQRFFQEYVNFDHNNPKTELIKLVRQMYNFNLIESKNFAEYLIVNNIVDI